MTTEPPIWGLALGSGSARGWAHLGVIRALARLGIHPRVVTGSSVGAMVGAAWAARRLGNMERWALSLRRRDVVGFLDLGFGSGLVKGERLYGLFDRFADLRIETLPRSYAAVATDFETGRRHCFTSGSVIDAVRASMAMPGLLPPVRVGEHWLVDGGLSDPVPVRLCRQLGATRVIAVDLNHGIVEARASRRLAGLRSRAVGEEEPETGEIQEQVGPRAALAAMGDRLDELRRRLSPGSVDPATVTEDPPKPPGLFDIMAGAVHILQDRVARVTLEKYPADVELCPRLGEIAMLEVYRAEEAIAEGRRVTEKAADWLRQLDSNSAAPHSPRRFD